MDRYAMPSKNTRHGIPIVLPLRISLFKALVKSGTIGGCANVELVLGSFLMIVLDLVIGPTSDMNRTKIHYSY